MYTFENQKGAAPLVPWMLPSDETPLRTGYLRAPGDIARCFASESFIDEIAADQKTDPVQFRLRYLGENKRGIDALNAVVKQARWQERPSLLQYLPTIKRRAAASRSLTEPAPSAVRLPKSR